MKNESTTSKTLRTLPFVLYLAVLLLLGACGSSKRLVETEKTKTEITETTQETETQSHERDTRTEKQSEATTVTIGRISTIELEYEGEPGDSVTIEQKADKIIISGSGKVNVKTKEESKTEESQTVTKETASVQEKTESQAAKRVDLLEREVTKSKVTDKESKGKWPWWVWVVLLIILSGGVYFVYKKVKRFYI